MRPVTTQVSFVGFVNVAVTVQLLAERLDPDEVAVYLEMAAPFVAVRLQDTLTLPVPASAAAGLAGVAGVPALTPVEADDAGEVPLALVAFTVKVYVVPFVSVPTVHVSGPDDQAQVLPPVEAVTVYEVMGEPFVVVGAVHDTVSLLLPLTAVGLPGAVGTPATTAVEGADAGDVPTPLWALTVTVYGVPFVSVLRTQLRAVSEVGEQVAVPGLAVTV